VTGRPAAFHVAKMRERITVATEVAVQDEATGQPVVTPLNWLVNEPASYEDASGGETARGRHVEADVSVVFTVRFRPGYHTQQVVIHKGVTYGIVHVGRVAGMDRYRELHCKAVS
jgi:hypothetical protein